jgi:hypothetical protein
MTSPMTPSTTPAMPVPMATKLRTGMAKPAIVMMPRILEAMPKPLPVLAPTGCVSDGARRGHPEQLSPRVTLASCVFNTCELVGCGAQLTFGE